MHDPAPLPEPDELRRQAEDALARKPAAANAGEPDLKRLVHELQVHQIELEMQNESLRQMHLDALASVTHYSELNEHLDDLVAARTADLLVARDIAESANRAKGSFLANMSHELRTPMNAIIGMTDLALMLASDPRQKDYLEKVLTASEHLLRIINDVLDLSKIDADRMVLESIPFRISAVLGKVQGLIGDKAAAKGLALNFDITRDLADRPLSGDPLRLGQVLLNLASNAVKFTRQGSVTVHARCISETASDLLVRFEVRDTGIGIRAEDQSRLFNAFEQADSSMTRSFGGTGLGLAISKRLVEMMGGAISVESTPARGSTFLFTARLCKGSDDPEEFVLPTVTTAREDVRARFTGARILLADDDPISREVTTNLLQERGLQVDCAESGTEAVARAREADYDLILMDLRMPGMDGFAATRAIRALPGRHATPIVALTANAFSEDRAACLAAGMDDHLGKPVNPLLLYTTLLKWLARPRH